ncbi:MAG: hypothetical protein ACI9CF_000214 [Candidatus Omnitrophota bacterium]|jgi:hypothetical protein
MAQTNIIGYRKKPAWIYVVATFLILIPLLSYIELHLRGGGFATIPKELFYQEIFCSASAALAILIVTRFSLLYFLGLSTYFIGFKLIQVYSGGWGTPFELAVIVFWLTAPLLFVTTSLKIPYLNPAARWWTQEKRFTHMSRGTLNYKGIKYPIVMIDFSAGGAFIKLDERIFKEVPKDDKDKRDEKSIGIRHPFLDAKERLVAKNSMEDYPSVEDGIKLKVQTLPGLDIPYKEGYYEVNAEVVWATKATDPIQYGLGLRFKHDSLIEKLKLSRYLYVLQPRSRQRNHRDHT